MFGCMLDDSWAEEAVGVKISNENEVVSRISSLSSNGASTGPPPFWSALLQLLYAIDSLVHPLVTSLLNPILTDRGFLYRPHRPHRRRNDLFSLLIAQPRCSYNSTYAP
ncbi:hypothetical protein A0J61_04738 [Choanephora cucurbitarum]|uniref:Uncharacterized protein n=1 Tax=Choanephora cucurbitarum TaxID=101091 RepID=A0A1C7NE44_9FUNG|nr:hypothetical protein A0J61_04738 [Choanephora cucurbitarum]